MANPLITRQSRLSVTSPTIESNQWLAVANLLQACRCFPMLSAPSGKLYRAAQGPLVRNQVSALQPPSMTQASPCVRFSLRRVFRLRSYKKRVNEPRNGFGAVAACGAIR